MISGWWRFFYIGCLLYVSVLDPASGQARRSILIDPQSIKTQDVIDPEKNEDFGGCSRGGCRVKVRLEKFEATKGGDDYRCYATSIGYLKAKGFDYVEGHNLITAKELVWEILDNKRQKVRFKNTGIGVHPEVDRNKCPTKNLSGLRLYGERSENGLTWTLRSKYIEGVVGQHWGFAEKLNILYGIGYLECAFEIHLEFSEDNGNTWKQCAPIDPVVVNKD